MMGGRVSDRVRARRYSGVCALQLALKRDRLVAALVCRGARLASNASVRTSRPPRHETGVQGRHARAAGVRVGGRALACLVLARAERSLTVSVLTTIDGAWAAPLACCPVVTKPEPGRPPCAFCVCGTADGPEGGGVEPEPEPDAGSCAFVPCGELFGSFFCPFVAGAAEVDVEVLPSLGLRLNDCERCRASVSLARPGVTQRQHARASRSPPVGPAAHRDLLERISHQARSMLAVGRGEGGGRAGRGSVARVASVVALVESGRSAGAASAGRGVETRVGCSRVVGCCSTIQTSWKNEVV